ncbi:signal peptidase I [Nonomuraea phyllanthi]|uniref:Signal peptidase I n=1 Tax=Nonomuraea phyllanthi TaxID=2219224 RepID=A0A5C4WC47_9ACTN|nr:signal peptidase I [Nonomuraea phyllanthi]KAB8192806.1 signal peptidase I [Nonomuraea phyllanthi]
MIRTRLPALALLLLLPASGCGLVESALGGFAITVPSESMEPTIKKGSRLTVRRTDDYVPRVGDIVVFRTPQGWSGATAGAQRVGRVIGVPESTVSCCDDKGRVELNRAPLEEPYLMSPPASYVAFEVKVPRGRLWIMNDNRHVALDSRRYSDAPDGGTVGVADVMGVVDAPARQEVSGG